MNVSLMPTARCSLCRSERHVITDDGPNVCFPCLGVMTNAAADPMSVTPRFRDMLAELHAESVRLGEADSGAQAWEWIA